MKNYFVVLSALMLFILSACSNNKGEEKNEFADSLIAVNKDLVKQLDERDQLIKSFMDGFNEIQTNLEEVRNKQLSVKKNSGQKGQFEKHLI